MFRPVPFAMLQLATYHTSVVTVITRRLLTAVAALRHLPTKIEPKPVMALGGGDSVFGTAAF
jgi:hypothetical protein